jgi:hypothetical protein
MNQNDFFIYHPDRLTRLIYADYLESKGDLFLASVLREEENIPITYKFEGARFSGGNEYWGIFYGYGSAAGSGKGDGKGSGGGWGQGDGYGWGCGRESGYDHGSGFGDGNGKGFGDEFF